MKQVMTLQVYRHAHLLSLSPLIGIASREASNISNEMAGANAQSIMSIPNLDRAGSPCLKDDVLAPF